MESPRKAPKRELEEEANEGGKQYVKSLANNNKGLKSFSATLCPIMKNERTDDDRFVSSFI